MNSDIGVRVGVGKRKMGMVKKRLPAPLPQEEMITSRAWTHAPALRPVTQTLALESPTSNLAQSSPSSESRTSPSLRSANSLGDSEHARDVAAISSSGAQPDAASNTESATSGSTRANGEEDDSRISPTAKIDDPQRAAATESIPAPNFEPTSKSCSVGIGATTHASISQTTATRHNTWITSTTALPADSVTIVPFVSLLGGDGGQAVFSAPTTTLISSASDESSVPQAETLAASEGTGSLAGISVASAIAAIVIVIAVVVYVRGGALRGVPHLRSKKKAPFVDQSQENECRRIVSPNGGAESVDDLEKAASSSCLGVVPLEHCSSIPGDAREGQWEEIDIRDPRSGNMEQDHGEWIEAWRRQKDALVSAQRRPPELQFNPALPLPPITLDSGSTVPK